MRKEICPICQFEGSMLPIVDSYHAPQYVRFTALSKESASQNEIMIGGPGVACQMHACTECHYVAFYYDAQATHPVDRIRNPHPNSILKKIFSFVLKKEK